MVGVELLGLGVGEGKGLVVGDARLREAVVDAVTDAGDALAVVLAEALLRLDFGLAALAFAVLALDALGGLTSGFLGGGVSGGLRSSLPLLIYRPAFGGL